MKKYFPLLLIITLPLLLFSQVYVSKSEWLTDKIVIDGKSSEWKKPFDFYNSKARLMFALANDSNKLYICFLNTEKPNQMRILNGGTRISIITKGKNKHNASISFPMGRSKMQHNDLHPGNRPDKIMMRNFFLKNNTSMKTSGFYTANGIISINDISGLKAAIDWDSNNNLVYEIAIPFIQIFGPGYTMSDLLNAFTLQVEIFPVAMSENQESGENNRPTHKNEDGMQNEEKMNEGGADHPLNSEGNWQGNSRNGGLNQHEGQIHQQSNQDRSYMFEKSKFKQTFFLSFSS